MNDFNTKLDSMLKCEAQRMSREDYDDLISSMSNGELKRGSYRNEDMIVEIARREFEEIGAEASDILHNKKEDVLCRTTCGKILR